MPQIVHPGFKGVWLFWDTTTNQITGFGLIKGDGLVSTFHGATTSGNTAVKECPSGMSLSGFVASQGQDQYGKNTGLYRIGLLCHYGAYYLDRIGFSPHQTACCV